jgi:hypothetical protein
VDCTHDETKNGQSQDQRWCPLKVTTEVSWEVSSNQLLNVSIRGTATMSRTNSIQSSLRVRSESGLGSSLCPELSGGRLTRVKEALGRSCVTCRPPEKANARRRLRKLPRSFLDR